MRIAGKETHMKASTLVGYVAGLLSGVALTALLGWTLLPGMMLHERRSPHGLDQTVAQIAGNAKAMGWSVSSISKLDENVRNNGGGSVLPVRVINLCQAQHATRVLADDAARRVAVFMPCRIAVYQKQDGGTYVSTLDAALLGRMFGGTVGAVMGEVGREQSRMVSFPD